MYVSFANENLILSWNAVAILSGFPAAYHPLGSTIIILGGLVALATILMNSLLHLMAVLLILNPTGHLRLLGADKSVLYHTYRHQRLLLALFTDLLGLLLAVLGVVVLLSFLGTGLHLKLADLLRLDMPNLLLNWERKDIAKLLAIPVTSLHLILADHLRPVHVSLAHLHLGLSRGVVTVLDWLPVTHHTLLLMSIVLSVLVLLAIKLD